MVSCDGEPRKTFWFIISAEVVEDSDNISNFQNTLPLDSRVQICSHIRDIATEHKENTKIKEKLNREKQTQFYIGKGQTILKLVWDQGRFVRKQVNGNWLKVNRGINFSCIKMLMFMKFEIFQTQNRRRNIINRKSHRKVSKLK